MDTNLRDKICNYLNELDDEILNIVNHCESGNYSMSEIADESKELRNKVY